MSTTYTVILIILSVAVALILSLLAAAAAAFLARADGATIASSLGRAGVTFCASFTLLALAVATISGVLS
ncbi:hypothetical protein ACN6LF_004648 [[Kitasatospora] papulosa]|uniref:hypothetical protein n=1 Tax=[Kitasatospora] papulosa TaxID=1464011 RepID=UPI0036E2E123